MDRSRHLLLLILVAIVLALLFATSLWFPPGALPDSIPSSIPISLEVLNRNLILTVSEGWNEFRTGEDIAILVQVRPDFPYEVAVLPNSGVMVFTLRDGRWVEVRNRARYFVFDPGLIISPGTDWMSGALVSVDPVLDDTSRPVRLRIFVIGHTLVDGIVTDQPVAGFVDVTLYP